MRNKTVCYKCNKEIQHGDVVTSDFYAHVNCAHTLHTEDVKNTAVQYLMALAKAAGK